MSDTNVAGWLKRIRKEAGFTQLEMAKVMGISESSLQAYEKGTRNMSAPRVRFFEEHLKDPKSLRTKLNALQSRAELMDTDRTARKWTIDQLNEKADVPYGITYDVLHGWYAHPEYTEKLFKALGWNSDGIRDTSEDGSGDALVSKVEAAIEELEQAKQYMHNLQGKIDDLMKELQRKAA